jgi:hypothetical protein
MKKIDLGQGITILANVGVIAGIVFLAVEIQQNSNLMQVQISQARADAAMLSNQQTFESAYIPTILVKIQQGGQLSDEDMVRYVNWFRSMNRNQENVLSQYDFGMLDETIPRSIEDFARATVWQSEYSREAWRITKPGYSDRYVTFIEDMVENGSGE